MLGLIVRLAPDLGHAPVKQITSPKFPTQMFSGFTSR